MEIGEKELKKLSIILIIALVGFLSFILIRPILYSILGGLILAYVFNPVYKKISSKIGNKTISIFIVLLLLVVITIIPLWFVTPLVIQQFFEIFRSTQAFDAHNFITSIFPTASEQFTNQMVIALGAIVTKASSSVLAYLINIFLDIPKIALSLFLMAFIFFYALRDSEKLIKFTSDLSPLPKEKGRLMVNQFKGITDSIIYGFFIVGIVQGILTGLGLLVFRVENALVLTILATFLSIIPVLGPYLIWIPVTVVMYTTGSPIIATIFLAYNLLIVSTVDNVLRSYLVSRKRFL